MSLPALRYPRLTLLCLSFLFAYVLFHGGYFDGLPELLHGKGYISAFLGGALFTFGFTAPFGLVVLIAIAPEVSIMPAVAIAAVGAVLSDMLLFSFIRSSLQSELDRLSMTKLMQHAAKVFHRSALSERVRTYLLWTCGGFIIASPLPDELGIALLGGMRVRPRTFAFACFLLDAAGIFVVIGLTKLAV